MTVSLCDGFGQRRIYHILRETKAVSNHIDSYYQVLSHFLDSLDELLEAFICASDYITHFLQIYFAEHKDRIPRGILVTGFDGSLEYANISGRLTTADVRTELLGKQLFMQIIYRMEYPDAPLY